MFRRTRTQLTVLCSVVALALATPAESRAGRIWDCLFGSGPPPQTTYAPPYAPVAVAAPCAAPACQPCQQPCQPCQPMCAPACGSCVPQTCHYMPGVVYRALYPPTVVTAYRPVAPCNTCVGYGSVTTYRPFLGTYETRLVPYTTYYRPVYAPAVSYAYSPYTGCSPYAGCGSCGGCSSCAGGACGVTAYETPAPSCPSCAAAAPSLPPPYMGEQPVASPATYGPQNGVPPATYGPQNGAPPRTFEEKANKPATEPPLKLIPQPEAQPSSMPTPALPDPNNRTAARRPVYSSARVALAAQPVDEPPLKDDGGWRAVKE